MTFKTLMFWELYLSLNRFFPFYPSIYLQSVQIMYLSIKEESKAYYLPHVFFNCTLKYVCSRLYILMKSH